MPSPFQSPYFEILDRLGDPESLPGGCKFKVREEELHVQFVREDILRIRIGRPVEWTNSVSPAVCAPNLPPPHVELKEKDSLVELTCGGTRVVIDPAGLHLDVYRMDGSVVCRSLRDKDGSSRFFSRLNDEWIVRRHAEARDLVYGLGEKTGGLDKRGRSYRMWNTDVLGPDTDGVSRTAGQGGAKDPRDTSFDPYYISIPFFYHGREDADGSPNFSGHFIDNPCLADFDFKPRDFYQFHFVGGGYTEYIFPGPNLRDILRAYTWLTGKIEPPPLWALGFHQCRWRRYSQQDVVKMAGMFREKRIPCDTLWLDIDYMVGYRVFTWNPELFPEPARMLETLRELGFCTITIVDPGVKAEIGNPVHDEGVSLDAYCKTESGRNYIGQVWPGRTVFPDFTKKATREWWGRLNANWVKSGLAGIWNDMNEPATGQIEPGGMRFDFDGKNLPHGYGHNLYAMFMAMGTTEGLHSALPGLRTFVLSRAGSPGIQRYAANWMGDNCSRWNHLEMSLPMALNLGLSGQPFVGADVGGFAEASNGELLARWSGCGAFTPFFRNHNMDPADQYFWSFGPAVESICREHVRTRYRLMPYIYSAFMHSAETGEPVQRPLVLDFQQDKTVHRMHDEYLFGQHLLIAPVFEAGKTSRLVYLPHGTWHPWEGGKAISGPAFVTAEAPLAKVPVYVRGGAVIPQWPEVPDSTMGHHPESLDLTVFLPEEDGRWESVLHEDDGLTLAFREGKMVRTTFFMTRSGERISVEAVVTGVGYPEFRRKNFRVRVEGAGRIFTCKFAGEPVNSESFEIPFSKDGFVLEISETVC